MNSTESFLSSKQQGHLQSHLSIQTLKALEWPTVQDLLESMARTDMGRQRLAVWHPSVDRPVDRAKAILELKSFAQGGMELPLGDIPNVSDLLPRISRSAMLGLDDFHRLVRFQKGVQGLHHFLNNTLISATLVHSLLCDFDPLKNWSQDHFWMLNAKGDLVDDASDDLLALRKMSRELQEQIKRRLTEYLQDHRLADKLQEKYVTLRDGRYVLPVKTSYKGQLDGIIHDVSHSEQTTFIEPQEIVNWNNQLKVVEKEIEKEIEIILKRVVENTKPWIKSFYNNAAMIGEADVLSAGTRFVMSVVERCGSPVCVAELGEGLAFSGLRHPLLRGSVVVANDISWVGALVVSGPNTGGKTVLLKSVGLGVLLAKAGLPVFADTAVIPSALKTVWSDIGDEQSLAEDLSTFSAHLRSLKQILDSAEAGDLVLIDEIATGTAPEEGQPLAQAFVEDLLDRGVPVMLTTHYGALKNFAMTNSRARIAAMMMDPKTHRPTYKLALDIPGESSAFQVAHDMGLAERVLTRARQLKGEGTPEFENAVKNLERARLELDKRNEELHQALEKAKLRESKAREKQVELESRIRQEIAEEAKKTVKELHVLRDQVSAWAKSAMERGVSSQDIFVKLSDTSKEIQQTAQRESLKKYVESVSELNVGTLIEVEGLSLGEVVSIPKDGKRVEVKIGELRSLQPLSKLYWPNSESLNRFEGQKASQAAAQRRRDSGQSMTMGNESTVCDVRGLQVDEAMRRVDNALNLLVQNSMATVTIVHGHGTEKLKDAIRKYLNQSRPDLIYRAGSWPGEGGDGVTIVEVRH